MKASTQQGNYPNDWENISKKLKDKFKWCCERCKRPHNPSKGYTLTVHHLDLNPSNNEEWNLAVLCQRCHLSIQARIKMNQLFFDEIIEVSDWFKPHLAGYKKSLSNPTNDREESSKKGIK